MKSHVYRWIMPFCLLALMGAVTITACGGGGEEATDEAAQQVDENLSTRQAKMKEISRICGGINKILKEGGVTNVASDAQQLKTLMGEVAMIPPPFDTEKYKFYAADFQSKADTLSMVAETGVVDDTKPAFITLTETCGVCHYTCKYPIDL